jgi:hypothetical protein
LRTTDRLLNIYIEDRTKDPFVIQANLLKACSPVFTKLIDNDSFIEGQEGNIVFKDNAWEAWHFFFLWLLKRDIPAAEMSAPEVIECIIFAEKYEINEFHKAISVILIKFDEWEVEFIRKAFARTSSRVLVRALLAAEMVLCVRRGLVSKEDLEILDATRFTPLYISFANSISSLWEPEHPLVLETL